MNPVFFKGNKTYTGIKTELASDLFYEIYGGDFRWERSTDLKKPLVFKPYKSGIHDLFGMFIAYECQINKDVFLQNIKIYDVAPTILHIFDKPIDSDVDGRVIKEIFEKTSTLRQKRYTIKEPLSNEL